LEGVRQRPIRLDAEIFDMHTRLVEMVALGPELRVEAQKLGHGVNESYMLVHQVLSDAFRENPEHIPAHALRDHLASRLRKYGRECAA
jgi:hypothetical protein